MRTSYTVFNRKFSVRSEHDAAFLSNPYAFFFLPLKGHWSRYQGWHICPETAEGSPFKILDFMGVLPENAQGSKDTSISVSSKRLKKKAVGVEEEYSISASGRTAEYKVSFDDEVPVRLALHLDPREISSFPEFGRIFAVKRQEDGAFLITYSQFSDNSLAQKQRELFIIVKLEGISAEISNSWSQKSYPFDEKRKSKSSLYVFEPFILSMEKREKEGKITVSAGNTAEEALSASSGNGHNHESEHESEHEHEHEQPVKLPDAAIEGMALLQRNSFLLAAQSLLSLHGRPEKSYAGIRAGLPWFFQFWTRDELISLIGTRAMGLEEEAECMLSHLLQKSRESGVFPAFLPSGGINSIDASGLVFLQCLETLKAGKIRLEKNKLLEWESSLEKILEGIESSRQKDVLIYAHPLETWMDTSYGTDTRQGACIELQALHATMHECLAELNRLISDSVKAQYHEDKQQAIEKKAKAAFFREGRLADTILPDGNADMTQRPNIFLAYLFHPGLLKKEEWKSAFDSALPELWLEWGGLSSISKNHPLYCAEYTGENNQSYHRGDSWIFINNIAAYCLHQIDRRSYWKFISRIVGASTTLLLSEGVAGAIPELSSAGKLSAKGCPVQAWSLATYLFLLQKLKGEEGMEEIFRKGME